MSWSPIEGAIVRSDVDEAVDSQLTFGDTFRDFAVRNAQPAAYLPPGSTGLEADSWQTKAELGDFPHDPHFATSRSVRSTDAFDDCDTL